MIFLESADRELMDASCTWNSLQPPTPATTHNALAALKGFAEHGIHPASFLIDDAWQDTLYNVRSLLSFGSKEAFLDGMPDLGELVRKAKEEYGVGFRNSYHVSPLCRETNTSLSPVVGQASRRLAYDRRVLEWGGSRALHRQV